MSDQLTKKMAIAACYNDHRGNWPKANKSGVLFHNGNNITIENFRRYKSDGIEMKIK